MQTHNNTNNTYSVETVQSEETFDIELSFQFVHPHMGHGAQDGKKVDEMSLFWKKYEAGTDR